MASMYARCSAEYTDRIFRGEVPANHPVQAPTKYELVVNFNTAQALGIKLSPSVLALAEEVIDR